MTGEEGIMDPDVFIPLAVFALVVLIVAVTSFAKIHDKEVEVHWKSHLEEVEHQRKMKQLDLELEQVRQSKQIGRENGVCK